MGVVRDYIEAWLPLALPYRDDWVGKIGQEVEIAFPVSIVENVYGDKDVIASSMVKKLPLMIDWKGYRLALANADTSEENNVPLTAIARVSDNIPRGSLVTVVDTEFSPDGGMTLKKPTTYVVARVSLFHEKYQHGRKLILVPYRGELFT